MDIHSELAQQWTPEDTNETCWELQRSGMIHCIGAENIAQLVGLTDAGIIYMENRFKDGLNGILMYLAKIKDVIPFI